MNLTEFDYHKIDMVLATLMPREEKVIRMRYEIDEKFHTLKEIGIYYGVTPTRIRQIEAKALRKLRHPSRVKVLSS